MHLSVRFSTEKELKQFQDLLYEKSGQGVSFTGLLEAMVSEVTIVTAVHNIKSNKGSKTAGVDRMKNGQVSANAKRRTISVDSIKYLQLQAEASQTEVYRKGKRQKATSGYSHCIG